MTSQPPPAKGRQLRMMLWMTLIVIGIFILVMTFVPQVNEAFKTVFGF